MGYLVDGSRLPQIDLQPTQRAEQQPTITLLSNTLNCSLAVEDTLVLCGPLPKDETKTKTTACILHSMPNGTQVLRHAFRLFLSIDGCRNR